MNLKGVDTYDMLNEPAKMNIKVVDTYDMLKNSRNRIVLANGVFDVLHIGHIEHLKQARAMGDKLVVGLTVDKMVNKGPGRPFNKWNDRAAMLRELRCVDEVVSAYGGVHAIRMVRPYCFVKGIDYADGRVWTEEVVKVCDELGVIITFTTTPKRSSSEIIRLTMAHP